MDRVAERKLGRIRTLCRKIESMCEESAELNSTALSKLNELSRLLTSMQDSSRWTKRRSTAAFRQVNRPPRRAIKDGEPETTLLLKRLAVQQQKILEQSRLLEQSQLGRTKPPGANVRRKLPPMKQDYAFEAGSDLTAEKKLAQHQRSLQARSLIVEDVDTEPEPEGTVVETEPVPFSPGPAVVGQPRQAVHEANEMYNQSQGVGSDLRQQAFAPSVTPSSSEKFRTSWNDNAEATSLPMAPTPSPFHHARRPFMSALAGLYGEPTDDEARAKEEARLELIRGLEQGMREKQAREAEEASLFSEESPPRSTSRGMHQRRRSIIAIPPPYGGMPTESPSPQQSGTHARFQEVFADPQRQMEIQEKREKQLALQNSLRQQVREKELEQQQRELEEDLFKQEENRRLQRDAMVQRIRYEQEVMQEGVQSSSHPQDIQQYPGEGAASTAVPQQYARGSGLHDLRKAQAKSRRRGGGPNPAMFPPVVHKHRRPFQ